MAVSPYLACHDVSYHIGATTLFDKLALSVHPGDRVGIVGPNGSGKSTLIRILNGELQPDGGSVARRGGLRLSYVSQVFRADPTLTVKEILLASIPFELNLDAQRAELERALEEHAHPAGKNPELLHDAIWQERLTLLQDKLEKLVGTGSENIVSSAMRAGRLTHLAARTVNNLSGGEQKRLQIVSALLSNPQLILLDEPTNHLDIETIDWLEEFLLEIVELGTSLVGLQSADQEPCAFVIVSHDRALLDTLAAEIVEIERGFWKLYEGNYETYVQKRVADDASREKTRSRMANQFRRELAWLRAGVKARTTKQVARIERAHSLKKDLSGMENRLRSNAETGLSFEAKLEDFERDDSDTMVPAIRNLGKQDLLVLKKMDLRHPGSTATSPSHLIFSGLNLVLRPQMRLALLGPNGCGKSTLLRLLAERQQPDGGEVIWHDLAHVSYFDQQRAELDRTKSVLETVCPKGDYVFLGDKSLHVMAYLTRFLFEKHDAPRSVAELSGGEQARVLLARLMLDQANVLLLDEPTNDLDIQSLQALERSLGDYRGAVLFTSHDRYFLQRVATHYLVWAGQEQTAQGLVEKWIFAADLDQSLEIAEKAAQDMIKNALAAVESAKAVAASSTTASSASRAESRKRKLGYQEERELKKTEEAIPGQEQKIAELTELLNEAYASGKPYSETKSLEQTIAAEQAQLDGMYARWEELCSKQG